MTSTERARAFLQAHLGQAVSMAMLDELSESFEEHRNQEGRASEDSAKGEGRVLRAVPDLDEEVDDDAAE